jgi:hypothetical protein
LTFENRMTSLATVGVTFELNVQIVCCRLGINLGDALNASSCKPNRRGSPFNPSSFLSLVLARLDAEKPSQLSSADLELGFIDIGCSETVTLAGRIDTT